MITAVNLMQIIGEQDVRIIPDIDVQSGQGGGNGMVDGLLGMVLREQMSEGVELEGKRPFSKRPCLHLIARCLGISTNSYQS